MRLLTLNSVVLSTPVLDEKGKRVRVTATHKSRLIEIDAYDHEHVRAGVMIDVSPEIGKELLAMKVARKPVVEVDDDGDDI